MPREIKVIRAMRVSIVLVALILSGVIGAIIDRLVVNHKLDVLIEKLKASR